MRSHTQSVVIEPNRRVITRSISYKPLISDLSVLRVCNKTVGTIKGDILKKSSSSSSATSQAFICSVSSNILFSDLSNRLRPFGPYFSIIFVILLSFILVTCRSQSELCLLSFTSAASTYVSSRISSRRGGQKWCTAQFF